MKKNDPNRMSRSGCLGLGIVVLMIVSAVPVFLEGDKTGGGQYLIIVAPALFIPLAWSRLKDAGINPWWSLLMVVPLASLLVAGVCIWTPSKENQKA